MACRVSAISVFMFATLFALPVCAQNLVSNPGLENNPPPGFGDHVGYSIAPWVITTGIRTNVISVDGGATFNYGIAGPALDADPATGVGVSQHYLDIYTASADIYQAVAVPLCGAPAGTMREVTYSGWFSTRGNQPGTGSVTLRAGIGTTGALLATSSASLPAPVPPATSSNSPWVQVTGTATVAAGSTISYVGAIANNLNFDEASIVFSAGGCVSSSFTLQKSWVAAAINDTAVVRVTRGGTILDSFTSVANTATEVDADPTPSPVFPGDQLIIAETLPGTNAGVYAQAATCSGGATLSGGIVTVDSSGTPILCRYTNSRGTADLSLTKTNTPGANGEIDLPDDSLVSGATAQYTLSLRNAGPGSGNGAVIRDPPQPNLACTSVTCGNVTGGAVCPAISIAALQSAAGVTIATLPANSSLEFRITCTVL